MIKKLSANFMKSVRKNWPLGLILIMAGSFILMLFSSRTDSMVTDEKVHIPAGYLHVWQGNYLFNTEHPPLLNNLAGLFAQIAQPNAPSIPADYHGGDQWDYGDTFFYLSENDVEAIIFWARLPFLFLTLGLIYLVFIWANTLFGPQAGLLAATLTAFSPNILAHGRLATTDIGVAFFFLLACWLLRKYFLRPNWQSAALLGLGIGLVLVSKFSGLFIMPIILIGLIFTWIYKSKKLLPALGQLLLVIIIPLAIIWLVYVFSMRGDIAVLPAAYKLSETFNYSPVSDNWLKWLIVSFDKFIRGVEILLNHNAGGHWTYLNGQVSIYGWWYYFPLVLWYKLPLPEIILLVIGLAIYIGTKKFRKDFFEEFFIIFPALLFLAISMIGRIDIGIRHILPILPFFYIFLSRIAESKNFIIQKATIILIICQIAIAGWAFPNYIAYFNQIAGGSKGGINHLVDSNLDWNQNIKRFSQYARENNIDKVYQLCWDNYSFEYYGLKSELLPSDPVEGAMAICAQSMKIVPDGFDISWVVKEPHDDIVGHGIYVWRFDQNKIDE